MIHYVTVAVALERPPTTQQYRRYALYGGTHTDAELTALQMAACTTVMPVSVEREPVHAADYDACAVPTYCDRAGCVSSVTEPHGALGCRCWPMPYGVAYPDTEGEKWQLDENCPYHGGVVTTPTGTDDEPSCCDLHSPVGGDIPPGGIQSPLLSGGEVLCHCGWHLVADDDRQLTKGLAAHITTEHGMKERRGLLATVRRWIWAAFTARLW